MSQIFSEEYLGANEAIVQSPVKESLKDVLDTTCNNQMGKIVPKSEIDLCDSTSSLLSLLDSFMREKDVLLKKETNAIFDTIERNEKAIFSPIPDYLLSEWVKLKVEADGSRKSSKSKIVIETNNDKVNHGSVERSVWRKSLIDPSVPLVFPFKRRSNDFLSLKNGKAGSYHDLFFGDGRNVTFPADYSKRKELENRKISQEALKKKFDHHIKPEYKFTPRLLKVPKDFVPSCATVCHSERQKELKEALENKKPLQKNKNTRASKEIVA